MTDDPTKRMVGGTHYLGLPIQPIEFAMKNRWDAGAFSVLKYATRHRAKNGVQDVQKGIHFVELRQQHIQAIRPSANVIPMHDYIVQNGIHVDDIPVLMALAAWVDMRVEHTTVLFELELLLELYAAGRGSLDLDKKSSTPIASS